MVLPELPVKGKFMVEFGKEGGDIAFIECHPEIDDRPANGFPKSYHQFFCRSTLKEAVFSNRNGDKYQASRSFFRSG